MTSWSAWKNPPSSQTDTERLRSRENPDRQLALDLLNTAGDESIDRNQPNRNRATMGKDGARWQRQRREAREAAAGHEKKGTDANTNIPATTTRAKKRGRARKHPVTVHSDDEHSNRTTATTNPTPSKKRSRLPEPLSAKKTPKRARRRTEPESPSYSADGWSESEGYDLDSEGERRERCPGTSTARRSLSQRQEMGERIIMTRLRRRTQPPPERAVDRGPRLQDDMYAIGATPPRGKGSIPNLEKGPVAKSSYTYSSHSGNGDDSTKREERKQVSPDNPTENAAEENGSTKRRQRKVISPNNPAENPAEEDVPQEELQAGQDEGMAEQEPEISQPKTDSKDQSYQPTDDNEGRIQDQHLDQQLHLYWDSLKGDNQRFRSTAATLGQTAQGEVEETQATTDSQDTGQLSTADSQGSECPERQQVQVVVIVGEKKDDGQNQSHLPTLPSQEVQQEEAEDEQADTNLEENDSQDSSHKAPANTEERMPDAPVPETSQGKDDAQDESCQHTADTEGKVQGESLIRMGQKKMDSQDQSYQLDEEDEGGEAVEDGDCDHEKEQDGDKKEGKAEKTRRRRFEIKRVISPRRYRRHQSTVTDEEEGLNKGANDYMDIDKILGEDGEDWGNHNDNQDQTIKAIDVEADKSASEHNEDRKDPSHNNDKQDNSMAIDEEAQRGASDNDENDVEIVNTSSFEQTEVMQKRDKATDRRQEKESEDPMEDSSSSSSVSESESESEEAIEGLSDHPAFVEAARVFDQEGTWLEMMDLAGELLRKAHSKRRRLISINPSVYELLASVNRARGVFDEHINYGNFTEPGQGLIPDIARKVSTVLSEVKTLPEEELVLQSPKERLKRQRMLRSQIRSIQSYVVPRMVEMIVPAAIIYHYMAKTQMERGLPEMKQLFRILHDLCEQVKPSRYSADVVFKDRLRIMRSDSRLLFYVYDNEMHKRISHELQQQQDQWRLEGEITEQNAAAVVEERAEEPQDPSTPSPSPPQSPSPSRIVSSPKQARSQTKDPFTRQVDAALMEGLQKYSGPNRYIRIKLTHKNVLKEFSLEQLRARALEIKKEYLAQAKDHEIEPDPDEDGWILTVN